MQTPQTGVQVTVSGVAKGRGFFLPFLGDMQTLGGTAGGSGITYKLPAIKKGAVFGMNRDELSVCVKRALKN